MKVAIVSSGSKANCSYLEHDGQAILIDCGLSAKQCLDRLSLLGVDIAKIKAILVTHEHGDHIRGLPVLSRKLRVPVYANKLTSQSLKGIFGLELFETGQPFGLEQFNIHPFSLVHDARDPVGFSIVAGNSKYTQATDLGKVTNLVRLAASDSDFLLLEANYDQQKLQECEYSWQLKQRISSTHGHLSNDDAGIFLSELSASNLKHVVLGHLSENSNEPELALKTAAKFNDFRRFKQILCASVGKSTELITV